MDLAGQAGIRFRSALVVRDVGAALDALPALDVPHRVEFALGAAIRDQRDDHAGVRHYLRGDMTALVRFLCEPADHSLDALAAAYVARRRAPVEWRASGLPLGGALPSTETDIAVARLLSAGISGEELLAALSHKPLYEGISHYYRVGTIHALGVRPLLILAAS